MTARRLLILALAYAATGWLGLRMPYAGEHITLVWLPSGIAVAALLRWGTSMWPAVYAGALLANLSSGAAWPLASGIALGNTLAPLLATRWLLHLGFEAAFERRCGVIRFIVAAAGGMTVSAAGGVACLYAAGSMQLPALPSAWLAWWMGDTVGVLLAAPLLLIISPERLAKLELQRREVLLWLAMACPVGWLVFLHDFDLPGRSLPLAFLTLPLVCWAAMRLQRLGAALAGMSFAALAAWGTGMGHGTFAVPDAQVGLFLLWSYMAVTVFTSLMIGALQAERERVEDTLRQSEERLKEAQEVAGLGNFEWDPVSGALWCSDELWRLWGLDPGESNLNAQRLFDARHPDDIERVDAIIDRALKGDIPFEFEYRVIWPDGSQHEVRADGRLIKGPDGLLDKVIGTVQDITERKRAEAKIQTLAFYDELTKLPNRRLMADRLGQALATSDRKREYGAVMMLDLDNFKVLNDTQGHDAGDQLLVEAARRIQSILRQEDTVARLGGDEYVVLIEGLGSDQTIAATHAEQIAEKILHAFEAPFHTLANGRTVRTTCSIGMTLFIGQELGIDELLKQADVALYQAKDAGRNTVRFFSPDMQAVIEARSAMEAAMHHGLHHDEFRLFYQPQINRSGRLTGAEALLRWFPHQHAPVSPAEFIPLAEETGLIVPLGAWVMQTACAQLQAWSADPAMRELVIAVNVSARQFRQPDFVQVVRDTLRRFEVNPALLKLELTESVVLHEVDDVIARMLQIKALGVSFSLDDFGTGFSSLSYLKRLPLDQVKIDRSFVRDLTTDASDAAIVRAIVVMSQSLGMQVIAEGVETPEQLEALMAAGCANYQGFLFGKPMPIEGWQVLDLACFKVHFPGLTGTPVRSVLSV